MVDPTLKNGTLTLEFWTGVKVGHTASLVTHFKTVTVEVPVLYKDSELFEVKVPERTGVGNTEALTETEKADIKAKFVKENESNTSSAILGNTHNKFIDNLKEGNDNIVIGNDGTATITYLDNSTDTIPGTSLVYEKTDESKTEDGKTGDYTYKKPYPVNDINDIQDEEVNKAKEDANKAIDEASSAGTAKAIGDVTAENIKNFDPKATPAEGVKPVDSSKLDEKK